MGLSYSIKDDEIISLFQKGRTISEIARELKTTYAVVEYRLIRNDLLIYKDGRYIPAKSQNKSIRDIIDEIDFLSNRLEGEYKFINIRKIAKLAVELEDEIPAAYEVYRIARAIRDRAGIGSYTELKTAIKRLHSENVDNKHTQTRYIEILEKLGFKCNGNECSVSKLDPGALKARNPSYDIIAKLRDSGIVLTFKNRAYKYTYPERIEWLNEIAIKIRNKKINVYIDAREASK